MHSFSPPLTLTKLSTPLGDMIAIADAEALYFLEFFDWKGVDRGVEKLEKFTGTPPVPGTNPILEYLRNELDAYFKGKLRTFETPLRPLGTPFQLRAWEALQAVPYGETQSYKGQAWTMNFPTAFRAVARANATNPIAILIPCHRIINHSGHLGGYGGGLDRKKWLLDHERPSKQ